ncbi:hypothetical protein EOM39_00105 [Candidatus Gracilibacteria bacterium]|nr:hypothetical protein [Candidatus Gracilibacteria bacterium]
MKKNIKKIIHFILMFFLSIIFLDIILGFFLEKNIKEFKNYKVEISSKSNMGIVSKDNIDSLNIIYTNGQPYWEMGYRGPYYNYKKKKTLNCRVLGMGGSTIWGAGVNEDETYFYRLSKKIKNSEFINISIPGSMPLQQIVKLEKEGLLHDTDLLLWDIRHDDFIPFVYSNGILYNSKIILNKYGNISLFNIIPEKLNNFLINYSLIYNKLLKIKISLNISTVDKKDVTEQYILSEIKKEVEKYLKNNVNNKVVFLMHPYLGINNKFDIVQHKYMKDKFINVFKTNNKVLILDLSDMIKGYNNEDFNLDDVHFNINGHNIVGNKLYDYIITNKLLNEKCY